MSQGDKLAIKELKRRIEQALVQDPKKARKAARIVEIWLEQEKEKQKNKKAG